ncbi:MAG: CBS domain-containing protein [Chloroflexi bacterium]|nr:CBS domain-containing protein [Chloroflexota bacterium]
MLRVSDIMTRDIVSVMPSASIIDVARQMRDTGTGVVPVCENGRFRGLITERDIVTSTVACEGNLTRNPAGKLVKEDRHPMISPGDELIRAAKVMASHGVAVLPVAQNGKLLGLITLENLARESLGLAAIVFAKMTERRASREAKA